MKRLLISYSLENDFNNFLESIGSYWILDFLYIYLFTPTTIAGFLLNINSLKILHYKKFKATLYHYLKVYTFNSAMINFLSISSCIALLDLAIAFEQITLFKKQFKIFKIHAYWISAIMFLVVFVFHIPYVVLYRKSIADINFNNRTHSVIYVDKTEFSSSVLGIVYSTFEFLVRDVLSIRKLSRYGNSVLRRNSIYYVSFKRRLNRSDRRLTQMIVFKCFLSIIEHILLLLLWYSHNRKPDFVANCSIFRLSFIFFTIRRKFCIKFLSAFDSMTKIVMFAFERIRAFKNPRAIMSKFLLKNVKIFYQIDINP
ncbi:hypothetical protein BpHYR1_006370 [Brachionus plicatilis]|uniref:Uncharacterized protein n=1 Tax=Brachionus plicatilis TaxID=10195 RepID=A0A3M7R682_BRAPC|nr:hypothetical protein BpHYR1_006370 [Brachionus plicatilis]